MQKFLRYVRICEKCLLLLLLRHKNAALAGLKLQGNKLSWSLAALALDVGGVKSRNEIIESEKKMTSILYYPLEITDLNVQGYL